jgi:predicted acetyltransferase
VDPELRVTRLADGEQLDFARAVMRHFHEDQPDEVLGTYAPLADLDRSLVVRDGDTIVANFGVDVVDISVPGGELLPCAGVTAVGVSQTHRRRGLLRRLMDRALDDAAERDEPVAALYASESAIYPRFGFGVSGPTVGYRIATSGLRFLDPVDPSVVRTATIEEAESSFPALARAARTSRPGGVDRTAASWHLNLAVDPEAAREGATARRLVHVPGRGYATYRVRSAYRGGLPDGEVQVEELVALDPDAEQALWQHLTGIDLTTRVTAWPRPVDDALPWMVGDRLRLHAHDGPPLYTRILDVPRCLGSRTSAVAGGVTLAVEDPSRDQTGTYRWDADPTGAACTRVDATPEVTVPIDVLAALWLGGASAGSLHRARRLVEHQHGAVARLAQLAASSAAPWTPWEF